MTVLADLVGELSWGLKAAWIAWAAWIAIQVVWRRRGRIERLVHEAPVSVRVDRLTLGLNAGPGAMSQRRMSRLPTGHTVTAEAEPAAPVQPMAASAVADPIDVSAEPAEAPVEEPVEEPVRTPKRPKRRRQSARQEAASAVCTPV